MRPIIIAGIAFLLMQSDDMSAQVTQQDNSETALDTSFWARIDRYTAIGMADSAIWVLEDAMGRALERPAPDTSDLIALTTKKAWVFYRVHRYADALSSFMRAAAYAEGKYGRWHTETGTSLLNAGNACLGLQDYQQADSLYRLALEIYLRTLGEDHLHTGWAWHDIGITTLYQGRYLESRDNFERALEIKQARLPEDAEDIARTLNYLGFLYNLLGDYERGERATEQSARINMAHFGPEHLGYYYAKNNLTQLHLARGEYDLAIASAKAAVTGKLRLLDTTHYYDVSLSFNWLGLAYQASGAYDSAQSAFEQALVYDSLSVIKQPVGRAHVLHNLGTNYMHQGRPADGEAMLNRALAEKRKLTGEDNSDYYSTLLVHGGALHALGRHAEALSELRQGRDFLERNGLQLTEDYAYCLESMTGVYTRLEDPAGARETAIRLAELSRNKLLKLTSFGSERELVHASEQAARNIHRLYSIQRRFSVTDQAYINLLADETLYYKGFVLFELARVRQLHKRDTALSATFAELNLAKSLLMAEHLYPDATGLRMAQAQHRVDSLEKILLRDSPAYSAFHRQLTRMDLTQALDPGEILIEFIQYPDGDGPGTTGHEYAALIFRHGDGDASLVHLPIDTANVAAGQLSGTLETDIASQQYTKAARIWAPLESHLHTAKTIYYVPDGMLYRTNPGAMTLADGNLVMERFNLIRLMSSRAMVEVHDGSARHMTAAIFGGVAYDSATDAGMPSALEEHDNILQDGVRGMLEAVQSDSSKRVEWAYLPGSLEEADRVAQLLEDNRFTPDIYTATAASEANFARCSRIHGVRLSPWILHISTHGYFFPESRVASYPEMKAVSAYSNARHPMIRSGLVMAGANAAWTNRNRAGVTSADGILTAYEIGQLDFSDTELVVLSACETGLGDVAHGEGVMGLQRAFKVAGARHIIMSLWAVPDAVTSLLMQEFYMNWIVKGRSLRQSLVTAQLYIRDAGFSPFHWAGFVMVE